ncbi:MAG: prepilin-type N-terminal cleavage/methylation domain-containing protein [Fretibacterium sp.]|nr:prepilin-type N-terminal cleavage/methylation domain-containing protein [Fretibacterium sp.]
MRRRGGFTLVELLIGTLLASVMGLVLITWGRWFLLVFNRSSCWLLAYERGQRVLAFIESKVLRTGLGLSACREDAALRQAFARGVYNAPSVSRLLTVYQDKPTLMTPVTEEDGVFRGTALGLLCAYPSGLMARRSDGDAEVTPGATINFTLLSGDVKLSRSGFQAGYMRDLASWCALPLAGMPFYITSASTRKLSLTLASTVGLPISVPPVNELYLLQYARFCVLNGQLCFQQMDSAWSPLYPREEGVLALWVEWRPELRVLDLWVLTSGGPALFGGAARLHDWPPEAPWRDDFGQHTLCVARASWRLRNL